MLGTVTADSAKQGYPVRLCNYANEYLIVKYKIKKITFFLKW